VFNGRVADVHPLTTRVFIPKRRHRPFLATLLSIPKRHIRLEHLNSELRQRINFFYEHSHKSIGHILITWGGFLTLLSLAHNLSNNITNSSIYLIAVAIFSISTIILFCVTQRDAENRSQIFKLATYLTIFYGRRACKGKNDYNNFWEVLLFERATKEDKNANHNKQDIAKEERWRMYMVNYEYFALAIVSNVLTGVFSFLFLINVICKNESISLIIGIILFIICLFTLAGQIIITVKIYKRSTLKNVGEIKKGYFYDFLEYAIETGYLSYENAIDRFGENFLNEIGYPRICPK